MESLGTGTRGMTRNPARLFYLFTFLPFYFFTFLPLNSLLPFLSCDNNRYASQDSEDAYRQLQRETLAEDAYADDDGCYWLQGSHDGGWRAADEIDGDGHEEERQYRWQQSQLGSTEPLFRRLKHLYRLACNKRIDEHRDESEHQNVEGKLDVRHARILPLVDGDDVKGIEQG